MLTITESTTREQFILDAVTVDGLSLNQADKAWLKARKEAGLHKPLVSRKDDAMKLLAAMDLTSPLDTKALVDALMAELNVAEGTARDYIKAFAQARGLEVKQQAQSAPVMEWIAANAPTVDDDTAWAEFDAALNQWGKDNGRSQNNINEYRKGIKLHRMLIAR